MADIEALPDGDFKIAPTHQKPTGMAAWMGEDFHMGTMLAGAALSAAVLFSGGAPLSTLLFGAAGKGAFVSILTSLGVIGTGGLIGGLVNKYHAEKQAEEGIEIEKPSFFNRGIFTEGILKGGLNGMIMAVGLMGIASIFSPALGIAGLTAKFGMMVPLAIAGASAAIGAVRGSVARKEKMETTYNQVKTAYMIQTGQPAQARGLSQKLGRGAAVAAGVGLGAGASVVGGGAPDPTGMVDTLNNTGLLDRTAEAAPARNPYDFSYLENHPAAQARRSFVAAEQERQIRRGQGAALDFS